MSPGVRIWTTFGVHDGGTRMPKIDFLKPWSVLEQFFGLGRSLGLLFSLILKHFCMFLVDLLAFLGKQFCLLRCYGRVCYSPYLFQFMIMSFPFIAFSLHLLLHASASSAPFPPDISDCN